VLTFETGGSSYESKTSPIKVKQNKITKQNSRKKSKEKTINLKKKQTNSSKLCKLCLISKTCIPWNSRPELN
jgi:hypothetical protein